MRGVQCVCVNCKSICTYIGHLLKIKSQVNKYNFLLLHFTIIINSFSINMNRFKSILSVGHVHVCVYTHTNAHMYLRINIHINWKRTFGLWTYSWQLLVVHNQLIAACVYVRLLSRCLIFHCFQLLSYTVLRLQNNLLVCDALIPRQRYKLHYK